MGKHLVLGFGTGRSGTTSLSAFLNAHDRVQVLHEGRIDSRIPGKPFAWEGDEENVLNWIREIVEKNDNFVWVGDIGMYYINYVDIIRAHYPDVRFICMQRPAEEVVASYLKWTKGKNHWMVHDGTQWKFDAKWDKAYPKFETIDKEMALRMYCTTYAQQVNALQKRLPEFVKVVNLADFNDPLYRASILDFIQYTGVRHTDAAFVQNSIAWRERIAKRRKMHHTFWAWKRKLLGSPGNRWFSMKKKSAPRIS